MPDETPSLFPLSEKEEKKRKKKAGKAATPLMRQYWKIKDRHPGAILLFRMGDFYETFEDDADRSSPTCSASRSPSAANGAAEDMPLAGFPHHALDQHLPKLVQAGLPRRRVRAARGPEVRAQDRQARRRGGRHAGRRVPRHAPARRSTPPTSPPPCWGDGARTRAASASPSPTRRRASSTSQKCPRRRLEDRCSRPSRPAEVLVDKRQKDRERSAIRRASELPSLTPQEDWVFGYDFAYETLLRHFQTHSLKGFGVDDLTLGADRRRARRSTTSARRRRAASRTSAASSATAPTTTSRSTRRRSATSNSSPPCRTAGATARSSASSTRRSRRWAGGCCASGSSARSATSGSIQQRLDAVDALFAGAAPAPDAPRGARATSATSSGCGEGLHRPRDAARPRHAPAHAPRRSPRSNGAAGRRGLPRRSRSVRDGLTLCTDLVERIGAALVDEPPAKMDGGGYIRAGFSRRTGRAARASPSAARTYLARAAGARRPSGPASRA